MTIPYSNPNDTYFDGLEVATDHRLVYTVVGFTTPKNVYNSDGTDLGSKIALGSNGTLNPQIFLGEGQYDVMLERYVAGDRLLDASWENAWAIPYTIDGAPTTGATTNNMAVVATRADLKALPSTHGYVAVVMLGYYTAYDGGGGIFTWKADSTTTDDFGWFCELDEDPATGRFIFSPTASDGFVSTATYGVLPGLSGTADARIETAGIRAGANGRKLLFANGVHSISADVTIEVNSILPRLAYFTAPDDSSVRRITFTTPIEIEDRSPTYPIVRKPYTQLYLEDGTVPACRPEWWDDDTVTDHVSANKVSFAVTLGNGVVTLGNTIGYDIPEGALSATFIIEQDVQLFVTGNTQFDGQINVTGIPYWKIFEIGVSGNPVITNKHQGGVNAWWFGWTTDNSETQAVCLGKGYSACRSYNHEYIIPKQLVSGADGYIDSAVSFNDAGVTLNIADKLTLTTNGSLVVYNLPITRRQYFAFNGSANGESVVLVTGVVYPEWFGAIGNGVTNDSTAMVNCVSSARSSVIGESIIWIDLGGKTYSIAQQFSNITTIGFRFGTLTFLSLYSCDNIEIFEVRILSNYYSVSPLTPVNSFIGCNNILLTNCIISNANTSMPIACYGTSNLKLVNCKIRKPSSSGVPFYFDYQSSYSMEYCSIEWLSGGDIYIAKNANVLNTSFTSGGSSTVYLGYDGTAGQIGTDVSVRLCSFVGCQIQVNGVNNIDLYHNTLKGVYTSTFIELYPRATGEPINVNVQDNFMNWTNTPSTTCYTVKYTTSLGSYVPSTNNLFGSLCVRNNRSNVVGALQTYYANKGTVTNRIVREFKTHGKQTIYVAGVAGGGESWDIDDNYIGTTINCLIGVSLIALGGATVENTVFYNQGIVTAFMPRIAVSGIATTEVWLLSTNISTSAVP